MYVYEQNGQSKMWVTCWECQNKADVEIQTCYKNNEKHFRN